MREGSDVERFNREVLAARERRRKAAENPGVWRIGESPGTHGRTVYVGTELAAVYLDPDKAQEVVDVMNAIPTNEKHKRTGVMTNQPGGYDADRPHASAVVCERDQCQANARFYVQGVTGEPAVYVPDRKAT